MPVVQFLRKVPLFNSLSEADLARLAESSRERNYPRNSVILFEDDPGDALYVVVTGQVKVVLIGEDGREVLAGEAFVQLLQRADLSLEFACGLLSRAQRRSRGLLGRFGLFERAFRPAQ